MLARMVASNLIHWLILEAAKKHRKDPKRMSPAATLRLTTAYSLKMSTSPAWRLGSLYEELLEKIACSLVPYRPDRIEPRMIKRETKHYPKLKISRSAWKNLVMAA